MRDSTYSLTGSVHCDEKKHGPTRSWKSVVWVIAALTWAVSFRAGSTSDILIIQRFLFERSSTSLTVSEVEKMLATLDRAASGFPQRCPVRKFRAAILTARETGASDDIVNKRLSAVSLTLTQLGIPASIIRTQKADTGNLEVNEVLMEIVCEHWRE